MPIRIAILYPTSVPWIGRFLDGVREYAQANGEWHIIGSPPSLYSAGESALTLRSMQGWKGDGIIISSNDVAELRYAKRMGIPVLNLLGGLPQTCGIPRIMVDHYKAGRIAAEHMLERGLVNLAFFGWENLWYSKQRCRGFMERAAESGARCEVLLRPTDEDARLSWNKRINVLIRWLSSLPLPCGIFAVQDYRGRLLLEACHEVALRVPEDIAVIGMDNDEITCEHSVPRLSSIARNAYRLGREAASIMHTMIKGRPVPSEEILIPPSEVVVRESSDMLYCSDPLVRDAIEYMRKNLSDRFNIEAVAEHLGVSKRKLEIRFSKAAKSSPHQYLTRLRILYAQALIKLDPKKNVETVAWECGFYTHPTFYAAFQKIVGMTPASYRTQVAGKNE